MSIEQSRNTRVAINRFGRNRRAGGAVINTLQQRLSELNQRFPDERYKPTTNRNPDYVLERSKISETLGLLTVRQRHEREKIREYLVDK